MTDPLSIAAATVALITSALAVARSFCELVDDIKTASSEIILLAWQLREYEKVLDNLQGLSTLIKQHPDVAIRDAGLTPEFAKECTSEMQDLQLLVRKLSARFSRGGARRLISKLQWSTSGKSMTESHAARMAGQKTCLLMSLNVLQSRCVLMIDGRVQQIDTLVQSSADKTSQTLTAIERGLQQSSSEAKSAETHLSTTQLAIQRTTSESLSITKSTSSDLGVIQQNISSIDEKLKDSRCFGHTGSRCSSTDLYRVNLDPRNHRFYGRDDTIESMKQELIPSDDVQRLRSFALYGMAGVAIFWIPADTQRKLARGFVDIAKTLGYSNGGAVEDQDKSFAAVKRWFIITELSWLLVLDNADDISIIREFWPDADKGSVIVTSQNPASKRCLAFEGAELTPLTPSDGVAFTRFLLGTKSETEKDDDVARIPKDLGYLPLAIDQMVSIILETDCTISKFQEMYDDREQANELQDTPFAQNQGYAKTVAAVFEISLARLDENARSALQILAFFDPDQIPEALLTDSTNHIPYLSKALVREKVFRDLRSFSLISRNPTRMTLAVHRLLRDAAFRSLGPNLQKMQATFANAVQLASQSFPKQSPSREHMTESWGTCETFVQHIISLHDRFLEMGQKHSLQIPVDFIELLYNCSWYLFERGRYELSFPLAKTAEVLYPRAGIQDHELLLADIYSVQGAMHIELTEMETASSLFKRAMRIREDAVEAGVLDNDHPNRANSYMNLGVSVGHYDTREAIKLHENALEIRLRSSKFEKSQIQVLSLNYLNIGRCWWIVGELDKAAEAYDSCLEIIKLKETKTGLIYAQSAWAMWAKGNVEIDRGNLDEAFDLHTRSMELLHTILGPTHRKTAACYHKIAWFLYRRGDYDRAMALLQQTLDIFLEKDGSDINAHVARTRYKLAAVMRDAGQAEAATAMKKEAQILRHALTGKGLEEGSAETEQDYDELVAYFYR